MKVGDLVTVARPCANPRTGRLFDPGELGLITGEKPFISATDGRNFFVLFSRGVEVIDPYFLNPAADTLKRRQHD